MRNCPLGYGRNLWSVSAKSKLPGSSCAKRGGAEQTLLGSSASSVNGTNILNVGVDDEVVENKVNGSPNPRQGFLCRDPSASSTPNRSKQHSLGDEIREMGLHSSFEGYRRGNYIVDCRKM